MLADHTSGSEFIKDIGTNSSYGNSQSIYAPYRIPMLVFHPSKLFLHFIPQIRTIARMTPLLTPNFNLAIKHALSILDIDCYHGTNLGGNNPDRWFFLEAARAKVKGQKVERTAEYWDQVLGKFGGVSDFPCIAFTDELIEAYPDAKVILVERDVNSWTGSFIEILEDWRSDWKFQLLTRYAILTLDSEKLTNFHQA